jgi:hypothetical protein
MTDLGEFWKGLEANLTDRYARPFVCTGSPLECRSFIVGLNAATRLYEPLRSYWSNSTGFDRPKFDRDYDARRLRRGNRPRIEAIAKAIGPCLETNLYAIPTMKAKQLTKGDRRNPIICYLFRTIRPELVFVHSNEPVRFFEEKTGCTDFTREVKRVRWQGHEFQLLGHPGPLFTSSLERAANYGAQLAEYMASGRQV